MSANERGQTAGALFGQAMLGLVRSVVDLPLSIRPARIGRAVDIRARALLAALVLLASSSALALLADFIALALLADRAELCFSAHRSRDGCPRSYCRRRRQHSCEN
jgi:hypothetical protein